MNKYIQQDRKDKNLSRLIKSQAQIKNMMNAAAGKKGFKTKLICPNCQYNFDVKKLLKFLTAIDIPNINFQAPCSACHALVKFKSYVQPWFKVEKPVIEFNINYNELKDIPEETLNLVEKELGQNEITEVYFKEGEVCSE